MRAFLRFKISYIHKLTGAKLKLMGALKSQNGKPIQKTDKTWYSRITFDAKEEYDTFTSHVSSMSHATIETGCHITKHLVS